MDDWPSHTEELTRKTSEQLDKWSKAYDAGKITKREFFIVVTTLYDTTSGLIKKDLSDLIADIHAELRAPSKT
ncbi:hypothetical protein PXK56_18485 [Phaeobacter gallaeciensis]|uniref:hypothetical protein n=1 Tax=Phaeobacter gallaeciensis TaxID=60890 RepID=UPI0023806CFB|nr:hypothetical protein [Phaeobacter gallaeciensis]MDE4297176.1 hypothetical protein [Phaeobacter gallaeciensis]